MIGFIAFDFVLRIVFRSVMDMTFVIKVRGMDGDDGPCHAASFGIPAYVIAYLESPIHLSDSLFLPETPHLGPLRPTSTFFGASTTAASVVSSRKAKVSRKYSSTTGLIVSKLRKVSSTVPRR
jgi:hypothetical protein